MSRTTERHLYLLTNPYRIKAILDANRNSLMLLELKFSIGTLSLSTAALIAAFFGMNLKNFMEESDLGFGGVCVVSFAVATVVCGYGLSKLRRVQKVSMWGEQGVAAARGRNFRSVDGEMLPRVRCETVPDFARKARTISKNERMAIRMARTDAIKTSASGAP